MGLKKQYLLDTQIFLWELTGKLGNNLLNLLTDSKNNELYLSKISLMEIAIKIRDGKLKLAKDYRTLFGNIDEMCINLLDIEENHLIVMSQLKYPKKDLSNQEIPFEHKDPFDHMLISQAIADHLWLISSDEKFSYYQQYGLKLCQVFEKKGIADIRI